MNNDAHTDLDHTATLTPAQTAWLDANGISANSEGTIFHRNGHTLRTRFDRTYAVAGYEIKTATGARTTAPTLRAGLARLRAL